MTDNKSLSAELEAQVRKAVALVGDDVTRFVTGIATAIRKLSPCPDGEGEK